MTNFGFHLTKSMSDMFGLPTDAWPENTEHVTPFFTIVVNALGRQEATEWFEAADRAQCRVRAVEEAGTYQLRFAV
ncbi:hypothetical protein ACUXZZ_44850 [Streptomyces graminifolii]|uniref:hypothetical protein n=1 Tax=Streptomyces graminifolii TaxID=1266771 RepID=UPI00405A0D14